MVKQLLQDQYQRKLCAPMSKNISVLSHNNNSLFVKLCSLHKKWTRLVKESKGEAVQKRKLVLSKMVKKEQTADTQLLIRKIDYIYTRNSCLSA